MEILNRNGDSVLKICICGGGSLGHVCAGVFASHEKVEVNILTGHPEKWSRQIEVTDSSGKRFEGKINKISRNPADVVPEMDIVFLCLPGYLIEQTLAEIRPFVGDAAVGTVVSSTGFFFFAHGILDSGTKLFGFQRVPYIARVAEYGRSANLLGYKSNLYAVLENIGDENGFKNVLEKIFLTPVSLLDNFLEVSLSNSNPILHTGRLFSMFYGRENQVFDHRILFYKEWTDEASQLLIDMDREFFELLGKLGVSSLKTLLDYYESHDASSLTEKISNIPAFQTIESPMREVVGGWTADFGSRYFTEDFPFGLRWIKELSDENGIETPIIDKVYSWGMNNYKY